MPNRIIREGILSSDRVNALDAHAELFYRRLMSVVDDFGRFDARPAILRVTCYPLRVDTVREADISRWLAEVQTAGLIALYAVNGAGGSRWLAKVQPAGPAVSADEKCYLVYLNFRQAVRAKESRYPAPPSGPMSGDSRTHSTCVADESQMSRAGVAGEAPVQSEGNAHAPGVGVGVGDGDDSSSSGVAGRGSPTGSAPTGSAQDAPTEETQPSDESGSKPDATRSPTATPEAWAIGIAERLRDGQAARLTSYRQPTPAALSRWAVEIERLHRIDGVPVADIRAMVEWVLRDAFWANNIQSGGALREHWNKLVGAKARPSDGARGKGRGAVAPAPSGTDYNARIRERQAEARAAEGGVAGPAG